MFDNSIVRIISVLLVMLIVGLIRYAIGLSGLRSREDADGKAKAQLIQSAKKTAVIGAFVYMVAMVSVVGLFM